jgi:HSP20 family molecular chaperone IbpA
MKSDIATWPSSRPAGDGTRLNQWALLAGESWETAKLIIVKVEMPGIRKEDIDVSISRGGVVKSGTLSITRGASTT